MSESLWSELVEKIPEFMAEEDRQDPSFRLAVLNDQIGDLNRHTTHDPELNPSTRPLQEDEAVAFGDALWQLLCVAHVRDVNLDESLSHALDRMDSREGYLQQSDTEMTGLVAHRSQSIKNLSDDSEGHIDGVVGQDVVVFREFRPEDTVQISDYDCVLTEIGGVASHAATVAREEDVASVVGVSGLTENVQRGDTVRVDLEGGRVKVLEDNQEITS